MTIPKLVKCKSSNRFLIKDEWYEVTNKSDIRHSKTGSYDLINHTNKRWSTSWYHENNFYTLDEIKSQNRDIKLNQILLKDNLF